MIFTLAAYGAASPFLLWRVAARQVWRRLPCGCRKEQQCLAAGVACRYTADAIVLFLIAEAALHGGRAQCPDYSPGYAYVSLFILGLRTFADKTGCYAVFGTVPPVIIVGIDGVSADSSDIDACQFLLIFNALL